MNFIFPNTFKLISQEKIAEITSDATIFEHSRSGAKLLLLLNDDDNKVFNIAFKTPPENDNGIAHIMEHSVLCGSKKYPLKEPFVELMKSSLNTFLNAMTYPDKTIYPVASRNTADFKNLVDVYLDAVFYPELSREAFEQEGWHLEKTEDGLEYKGVVYNEMKGVFSSPESFLDLAVNRALFADSTYKYESGGYPDSIPDLSYEYYKRFHAEKYHPANSWIILYGDIDAAYWLDYLDKQYLCHFSTPDFELPQIISQPPLSKPLDLRSNYPAEDETADKNSLISISFLTGSVLDVEHNFAMGVLDAILIGSAGSPLKKALIESGLGEDSLDYGYSNEMLQTTWSVGLRDASSEAKDAFVALIFSTLKKLVEEGIPSKYVEAAMNSCEFQLREANFGSYPKGLVYSLNVLTRWIYGGEPLSVLKYEPLLKKLKQKVAAGGYFERLIKENLLENDQYVVMVCEPDQSLEEEILNKENSQLKAIEDSLSSADEVELVKRNAILLKRQSEPDSIEALATIPHVSVKDIKETYDSIPTEIYKSGDIGVMLHDLPTVGIVYYQLSFDCSGVPESDYHWLALMNSLLLKMGTATVTYDDFMQEMACYTGGVSSTLNVLSTKKNASGAACFLWLQAKFMEEKESDMLRILDDIFNAITFEDIRRLKEQLGSMVSRFKNNLQNHGDRTARGELGASLSVGGYIGNLISGIDFFHFLRQVQSDLEKDASVIIKKLQEMKKVIFNQANLLVNVTCPVVKGKEFVSSLTKLTEKLPKHSAECIQILTQKDKRNRALTATSAVQYVVKGVNIHDLGLRAEHGSIELLSQLLSTGYLWEQVRVKGGAYGCYMAYERVSGALMLASYRDPNLEKTLDAFDGIGEYLENLELSEAELEKLIIGTIGRMDSPLTSSQKGKLALTRYLTGVDEDELNKHRKELLTSTLSDLKNYSKLFYEFSRHGIICVHGSQKRLNESKDLFDEVVAVIN